MRTFNFSRAVLSVVAFLGTVGTVSVAQAADIRTVCFELKVATTDSGIGEDYWDAATEYYPAKYSQVEILQGGLVQVSAANYTDEDGCITFDKHLWSGTWTFRLFGRSAPRRPGSATQFNYINVRKSDGSIPVWTWTWTSDNWTSKTLSTTSSRRSRLFAIATWAYDRLGSDTAGKRITVKDAECPLSPGNSCFNTLDETLYVRPEQSAMKFPIAHEVGHGAMYHQAGGVFADYSYLNAFGDWGDSAARTGNAYQCEWTYNKHHLHSWEPSSAAFTEGWSQFYATAAFNDMTQTNAKFHYYKDDGAYCPPCNGPACLCQYKVSPTVVDMELGSGDSPNAWLRNKCDCYGDPQLSSCAGDHSVKAGAGVELDWARQLWDFATNSGTKPSWTHILAIIRQTTLDTGTHNAHAVMLQSLAAKDAAWGTSFLSRWNSTAYMNGVDY